MREGGAVPSAAPLLAVAVVVTHGEVEGLKHTLPRSIQCHRTLGHTLVTTSNFLRLRETAQRETTTCSQSDSQYSPMNHTHQPSRRDHDDHPTASMPSARSERDELKAQLVQALFLLIFSVPHPSYTTFIAVCFNGGSTQDGFHYLAWCLNSNYKNIKLSTNSRLECINKINPQ